MSGSGPIYDNQGYRLKLMTEPEIAELKRAAIEEYKQQMEEEMAKDEQTTSKQVNQHHRMAMGKEIELKKGGAVKKEKKAEHKKKK